MKQKQSLQQLVLKQLDIHIQKKEKEEEGGGEGGGKKQSRHKIYTLQKLT